MTKPLLWRQAGSATHRLAHALRFAVLSVLLAGLFALLHPVPAVAHFAGSSGSPTNYRAAVTAIRPAVPTMAVSVGLGGQWVRVTNQGATQIVVLGYRGEPFLRLSEHQVQVNELSSTAAEIGMVPVSQAQDSAPGPRWVTQREADQAAWADARLAPPAEPAGAATSWELPLVVDGQQVTVLGTLDRVPPPAPWPWIGALVLLAAAVSALGWVRNWHRPMAVVVAAGISAFALHLLGTGLAPHQSGPVLAWAGIGVVGAFAVVIGSFTVVSTARRKESAPDRIATTGIMVLLLAATDITVLWNSQLPFAGPAALDRGLTVVTYGVAVGLLVAGARLNRQARARATAPGTETTASRVVGS